MASLLGHYVSKKGLSNLHNYKYSGTDKSLVANYIMQPIWSKAVNLLPLWMAPNLVTLLGFIFILLSYAATAFYHPDIVGKGPRELYLFNAACMLIYQTMDALDGKQARRTKSSSPLGELFDHGCDAVTTVVGALTLGCTLGVNTDLFLVALVLMMVAFYFAQWEEYYTGTLNLGYIGVTEAQIGAIGIYLITYFFGLQWWDQEFHLAGLSIRYGSVPFLASSASMIPTAISNFVEVIRYHSTPKPTTLFSALVNTTPVLALSVGFSLWAYSSPLYTTHPHTFLLAYGFLVANLVGRIVLDRVCFEKFDPRQPLVAPLIAVPFLVNTPFEAPFLSVYCLVGVFSYLHFALSVIRDLCDALKIKCLSIKKASN